MCLICKVHFLPSHSLGEHIVGYPVTIANESIDDNHNTSIDHSSISTFCWCVLSDFAGHFWYNLTSGFSTLVSFSNPQGLCWPGLCVARRDNRKMIRVGGEGYAHTFKWLATWNYFFEVHHLVEFMYLVFTRMPGESYLRRLRAFLLCLCEVFRALINSLVYWFCTNALGLVLFQRVNVAHYWAFSNNHPSGVLTLLLGCYMTGATWNCCRLGARSVYTIQLRISLQCHFIQSHIYTCYKIVLRKLIPLKLTYMPCTVTFQISLFSSQGLLSDTHYRLYNTWRYVIRVST